ncbi:hypothetical protein GCM10023094_31040 [Rhodococcus olei]|uniref:Uncharacterized protein n=1 Tax=Rhodococcus olei TaxID=2161675 RepID=A0ABP8P7I6_9NOCA
MRDLVTDLNRRVADHLGAPRVPVDKVDVETTVAARPADPSPQVPEWRIHSAWTE